MQAELPRRGQCVGFSTAGRVGVDLGRGLYIGDLGPRRVGDRGPHYWLHHLTQPALPGPGRHDRARPRAPRRPRPNYIIAASKTYGDAIGNNEPKMPEIVDLYAMVNRMRVLGMRKTTASADAVMRCENRSGHRSFERL